MCARVCVVAASFIRPFGNANAEHLYTFEVMLSMNVFFRERGHDITAYANRSGHAQQYMVLIRVTRAQVVACVDGEKKTRHWR